MLASSKTISHLGCPLNSSESSLYIVIQRYENDNVSYS